MNFIKSNFLVLLVATIQIKAAQQPAAFKWQRPDVMVIQRIDRFEKEITPERALYILGGSICLGTTIWSYAQTRQKAAELNARIQRRNNDTNLTEQRSMTPSIFAIIKQMERQKPAWRPIGRDIGKEIGSYIPNETFAKSQYTQVNSEINSNIHKTTAHSTALKNLGWAIPSLTLGSFAKYDDAKSFILGCNSLFLTFPINATISAASYANENPRKTAAILGGATGSYFIYKYRRAIRHKLGF